MTQDEIIEMAQECALIGMRPHLDGIYSEALVTFAKLVAEKALAEHAMRETQRLGQEIEQEPVFTYEQVKAHIQVAMMSTTPPQRKPLTDEQIEQLEQDTCAMEFPETVRAIEASHGIKENT